MTTMRSVKRIQKQSPIHPHDSPPGSERAQAFWHSAFAMGGELVRANQEYLRSAAAQWLRLWATPWRLAAHRPLPPSMSPSSAVAAVAAVATSPTRSQRRRPAAKPVAASGPVRKRASKRASAKARRSTRKKR